MCALLLAAPTSAAPATAKYVAYFQTAQLKLPISSDPFAISGAQLVFVAALILLLFLAVPELLSHNQYMIDSICSCSCPAGDQNKLL